MALDFPASPTLGQTYQSNNQVWTWNGTGWTTGYQTSGFVRQIFNATSGQTTFVVSGGYQAGLVDVYQNGVKLVNGTDVTVTSGSNVVLTTGAGSGDTIEVIGLANVAGLNFLPLSGGTLTGAVTGTTFTDGSGTLRPLVSGTAIATTSGTSADFTGIPSWVKRVTLMFNVVSTNGTSPALVQIGSGSVQNTGYTSYSSTMAAASSTLGQSTAGFIMQYASAAATLMGHMILTNVSGNVWAQSHQGAVLSTNTLVGGGVVTLSGALDRVRLTTVGGTDTFDAGSVNIFYE